MNLRPTSPRFAPPPGTGGTPALRCCAFTLIEMLVVMAVIVILAGLTIGGFGVIKKKTRLARVQAELARLQTAIESYKQSLGFYPPDNLVNPAAPPLFYELSGAVISGPDYQTLESNETISSNLVQQYFGRAGFANASTDAKQVKAFLPALKNTQYKEAFVGVDVELLVVPVEGPVLPAIPATAVWRPDPERVNPFHYVSTKPVHNPGEFDLWADLRIGSKTYRVSNWGEPEELKP
jgi:prepilin-type N-terminal cleavage/methylation domain-containing protein